MNKPKVHEIIDSLFPNLDKPTKGTILQNADYLKCAKGTKFISEGRKHHYFYLLLSGGVKSYYLKDSKEVCLWFAFENEFIATIKTFEGEHSNETIVFLEDSSLIRFKTESIKELALTHLSISQWIIKLITEHAVFLEERLFGLQFLSSKERYHALIKVAPEILQKVSLTDIASFLGVSRETLSRIRAQI